MQDTAWDLTISSSLSSDLGGVSTKSGTHGGHQSWSGLKQPETLEPQQLQGKGSCDGMLMAPSHPDLSAWSWRSKSVGWRRCILSTKSARGGIYEWPSPIALGSVPARQLQKQVRAGECSALHVYGGENYLHPLFPPVGPLNMSPRCSLQVYGSEPRPPENHSGL